MTVAFLRFPLKEKYASLEQLILQCKDLPKAKERTDRYIVIVRSLQSAGPFNVGDDKKAFYAFLGRLEAVENADVRAAASGVKKRFDNIFNRPGAPSPKETKVSLPLQSLALVRDSDGQTVDNVTGIRPIGSKLDVVWGPGCKSLYLMKKKGVLHSVWTSSSATAGVREVSFDGRFVWALVVDQKGLKLQLLVLDPQTEKVWEVTKNDPLPEAGQDLERSTPHTIKIAPAGPGRLCLVGSFGRTWGPERANLGRTSRACSSPIRHFTRVLITGWSCIRIQFNTRAFTPSSFQN